MYFLSCDRIETARDIARNDSACALHHDNERPYRVNALYAVDAVSDPRPQYSSWVLTVEECQMILDECVSDQ